MSAARYLALISPATPIIEKRTFITAILIHNHIFFAFALGGWTGRNVLTSFNPDIDCQTIHNPSPSTNSLPSRTT